MQWCNGLACSWTIIRNISHHWLCWLGWRSYNSETIKISHHWSGRKPFPFPDLNRRASSLLFSSASVFWLILSPPGNTGLQLTQALWKLTMVNVELGLWQSSLYLSPFPSFCSTSKPSTMQHGTNAMGRVWRKDLSPSCTPWLSPFLPWEAWWGHFLWEFWSPNMGGKSCANKNYPVVRWGTNECNNK